VPLYIQLENVGGKEEREDREAEDWDIHIGGKRHYACVELNGAVADGNQEWRRTKYWTEVGRTGTLCLLISCLL